MDSPSSPPSPIDHHQHKIIEVELPNSKPKPKAPGGVKIEKLAVVPRQAPFQLGSPEDSYGYVIQVYFDIPEWSQILFFLSQEEDRETIAVWNSATGASDDALGLLSRQEAAEHPIMSSSFIPKGAMVRERGEFTQPHTPAVKAYLAQLILPPEMSFVLPLMPDISGPEILQPLLFKEEFVVNSIALDFVTRLQAN